MKLLNENKSTEYKYRFPLISAGPQISAANKKYTNNETTKKTSISGIY